jgi:hypothetical protein
MAAAARPHACRLAQPRAPATLRRQLVRTPASLSASPSSSPASSAHRGSGSSPRGARPLRAYGAATGIWSFAGTLRLLPHARAQRQRACSSARWRKLRAEQRSARRVYGYASSARRLAGGDGRLCCCLMWTLSPSLARNGRRTTARHTQNDPRGQSTRAARCRTVWEDCAVCEQIHARPCAAASKHQV